MLDPSLSVATKRSFYSTEVEYQWFYHIIYNIAKMLKHCDKLYHKYKHFTFYICLFTPNIGTAHCQNIFMHMQSKQVLQRRTRALNTLPRRRRGMVHGAEFLMRMCYNILWRSLSGSAAIPRAGCATDNFK